MQDQSREIVTTETHASSARRQRLSIVVPGLNEERGIGLLLAELTAVLERTDLGWEILFVDDGSTDGTLAILRDAHAKDPRVKAVSLSRNFGKEIAVAAGLRYASGDAVILMDADLQHPPETIPQLIARWREGYDVVYAQRVDRNTDSPLRRLFARAFYRLFASLSGTELPVGAGDFRLLSRRAVDAMNRVGERARFNKGLYAWIGFRSTGVPYTVPLRQDGRSRWSLRKLWRFAIDGLASFSTVPLRVWSYLGLAISIFAFAYAAMFLVKTLALGADIPGFPTLIISIMILSGVQLISLGVIGEYLGRIYEEVKARPLFLVADEIGLERSEPVGASPAQHPRVRVKAGHAESREPQG